jgi:hypothetical protein
MKQALTLFFVVISGMAIAQSTKVGNFNLDKVYKISPSGLLNLTCSDAKVYITGSSRTDVHVKIDRVVETKGFVFGENEFAVDIDETNGNLTIKERAGSTSVGVVGYIHEKYTINIEAPEGISLRVRGDDGDYWIKTINGAMDLDLDDADVDLAGCKGNDFRIRIDDGDVKMDQGSGKLEVDADDADIEIRNAKFTSISADFDDGDFIIETSLADGGDYYINSQDGMIAFTVTGGGGKFDIRHDDASVRADDVFTTVEESEDRTRLTLPSGNAKVDIRADDARVRLAKN